MPEWAENPALLTIAVIAAAGAIWGMGQWVGTVNSDRKSFKAFIKKMPNNIKALRKEVRDDVKELRKDIKNILLRLPQLPSVAGQSPVQLTDFGKLIRDTVSATEWARKEAPILVESVRDKEEFEIYEACINHVSEKFANDSEFSKAVKAGAYQVGTESSNVLPVYQVELRDRILELISG